MKHFDAVSDDPEKHTKKMDRLKMEKTKSRKQVEAFKKDLAELLERHGKKGKPTSCRGR